MNKNFSRELYFFGGSVSFRVTKNAFVRILVISIVPQQSEKGIFTDVVPFCGAAFFIAKNF